MLKIFRNLALAAVIPVAALCMIASQADAQVRGYNYDFEFFPNNGYQSYYRPYYQPYPYYYQPYPYYTAPYNYSYNYSYSPYGGYQYYYNYGPNFGLNTPLGSFQYWR